jgi:uncharacterized membrane protein
MFHLKSLNDRQLDIVIATILRTGVLISALIVLAGGVLYLHEYGLTQPDYKSFHGEPADLRSLAGIWGDIRALRPAGIIQMGLLVLIATPICRVAFAFVAFAWQRDRVYMVITLIVLGVLIFSLTEGGR